MDALYLQIFVSLVLVLGSVILFAHSVRQRDNDHADRLALLPIEEDDPPHSGESNGHADSDAVQGTSRREA